MSRIISDGLPVVSNGLTCLPDEGSVKSILVTVRISRKRVSLLAGDTLEDRLKHFREKCYRSLIEMFQVLCLVTFGSEALPNLRPQWNSLTGVTYGIKRLGSHRFFYHLNHCHFRQCLPTVTWPEDR